jgi:putative acetyltransferase
MTSPPGKPPDGAGGAPEAALDVRAEPLDSPAARALIAALDAELGARYPEPGANHLRLDADEVAGGRGLFVIAWLGTRAVGCGAIRRQDADTDAAEVKRMYVTPDARGRGIGRLVLSVLEAEARRLGLSRLVLETGARQPEAVALYERAGFVVIPAFGEYLDSPLSLCMGKPL